MCNIMKHIIIALSIISIHSYSTRGISEPVEPIDLRIKVLKHKIFEQMKGMGNQVPYESDNFKEMYDYVDNSDKPITPISEDDQRKLDNRFKQPELRTTTTEKYVASPEEDRSEERVERKKKKKDARSRKLKKSMKPETSPSNRKEIFYRRLFFDVSDGMDRPQKWTHCLDLLAPFINGFLKNVSESKRVVATDHVVKRLAFLLSLNMTDAGTEDIRSIMYEISNLQLRIFQWDVSAIKVLMNVIIQNNPHTFRNLKYGLKNLFASWKLNVSNLTRVLSQTRIFRPPCLQVSEYGGSTATPKTARYVASPKREKSKCSLRSDGDCIEEY